MSDAVLTLIILGLAVVLFAVDRIPVAGVALVVPLALWATGVLELGRHSAGSVTRSSCSSRRCSS